jgi:hypothetical protein
MEGRVDANVHGRIGSDASQASGKQNIDIGVGIYVRLAHCI